MSIPQRKGDPIVVETDEGVRPGTTVESLGGLRPAFDKDGTITAGNASQISDGGSAVVRDVARRPSSARGVQPLGEVVSLRHGRRARHASLLHQPSNAIRKALERAGLEQSATSTCSRSTRRSPPSAWPRWPTSGITDDVVNVNGGAIALGHPIGMSGNRLALTLLHELRRRGGGIGAAALCGGGGQGDALIVRTV